MCTQRYRNYFLCWENRNRQTFPFACHAAWKNELTLILKLKLSKFSTNMRKKSHNNLVVKIGTGSSQNKQVTITFSHFLFKYSMPPEAFISQNNETIQLTLVLLPEIVHQISFTLLPSELMVSSRKQPRTCAQNFISWLHWSAGWGIYHGTCKIKYMKDDFSNSPVWYWLIMPYYHLLSEKCTLCVSSSSCVKQGYLLSR